LFAISALNFVNAATFTSVSSGTWSTPATWTVSGADADGIPDKDDHVTISVGHNVSLSATSNFAKSITNNGTFTGNSKGLSVYGDFTNTGTVVYGSIILYIVSPCVFSSTSVFSGATSWWINGDLTITSGTTINILNNSVVYASKTVTNLGTSFIKRCCCFNIRNRC